MLKKILIALGVFTGILALAAFILAIVYEGQVKKIIVEQINKQLIAPVKVGNIEFSLIKNFPKASLSFYGVEAQSVYTGTEQNKCPKKLLTAKEISLQFNLLDLFKGNYTINKIVLEGVVFNLFIDNNNKDNYHCWRTNTEKDKSSVKFKMNQIVMQESEANYHDLKQQLLLNILFKESVMKGEVFEEDFALVLNSNMRIKQFEFEKNQYLQHKRVQLQIGLLKQNNIFSFKQAEATVEKMKLSLSGTFGNGEIDFEAKGKELDVQSFLSLLPSAISNKFVDYTSEGIFALDLSIKGKQEQPKVRAGFAIANATLGQKTGKVTLHHINLKGYYSNGRSQNLHTSGVYINSFNATLNKSPIAGNFSIVDFTAPFIDGNINATFKLDELKEILQLDTFTVLQGNATLALRVSCPLNQLQKQDLAQPRQGELSGSLQLTAASMQFKHDIMSYDRIEADLYADDNYILVKQLNFTHGKSEVALHGELSNYQALFTKGSEKSLLKAYLTSANFELEDWLPKNQMNPKKAKQNEELQINNIDLKLRTNIARFKFDHFIATNLSSLIYFKEQQFRFDSLAFACMDGKANASGAIELHQQGGFDLICDATLSKINISKLFDQLNNFGQKTLTNKNLVGKLSAKIQYKSSWSNLNNIIPESILADASVLISDGELNNFTPMNKLSKFVSVNELSHIRFNELVNTISITNKKIYIPQFQIKSSAMNLYCSGTHDFENNVDYHFKVTLSELLSKKRKREAPKNNEFDEVEEDNEGKTTLFISMTGNIDHPIIKFDRKELKQYVKDEIKNEKQTVKQLLKDEFGLFKKDKNLKEKTEKKVTKPKEFDVEWEEELKQESNKETKEKQSTAPKKSSKGFGGKDKPAKVKEKEKQKEENSDDFL